MRRVSDVPGFMAWHQPRAPAASRGAFGWCRAAAS